jgi:hypothetical protein
MEAEAYAVLQIIMLAVRIAITVYCVNRAKQLNRSQGGWGLFGFFMPIIALIWIQFMKPKMRWESDLPVNQALDQH